MDSSRPFVPANAQPVRPSRRSLLKTLGAAAVATGAGSLRLRAQPAAEARFTVGSTSGALVPPDFTGLSYETAQLAHPRFFSRNAATLARYFGLLGSEGVLRIGGNLSEFTFWSDQRGSGADPDGVDGPDPGHGTDKIWTVNPDDIDGLAAFLDLSGWKLIYGLNLAAGEIACATSEAAYVAQAVGKKLLALQFGNEPDLFKHKANPAEHWTYDEFHGKWRTFYDAIHLRLSRVPVAGPDTSFQPVWMKRFCEEERSRISLLTGHYYAGGPPTSPEMTTGFLLETNARLQDHVLRAIQIARANGLPYRMSEGNTCYGAGKQGVSDTFASALWVLDFCLQLAAQGAVGVNLHGGGNGFYTPIAGSSTTGFTARPIFYGMMLAGHFAGATLLPVEADTAGRNVVTYAARKADGVRVVAINRTAEPVSLKLTLPGTPRAANVWRLEAPSLESTTGVTLAGSSVSAEGRWQPRIVEKLRLQEGAGSLHLAPYSAAMLHAQP